MGALGKGQIAARPPRGPLSKFGSLRRWNYPSRPRRMSDRKIRNFQNMRMCNGQIRQHITNLGKDCSDRPTAFYHLATRFRKVIEHCSLRQVEARQINERYWSSERNASKCELASWTKQWNWMGCKNVSRDVKWRNGVVSRAPRLNIGFALKLGVHCWYYTQNKGTPWKDLHVRFRVELKTSSRRPWKSSSPRWSLGMFCRKSWGSRNGIAWHGRLVSRFINETFPFRKRQDNVGSVSRREEITEKHVWESEGSIAVSNWIMWRNRNGNAFIRPPIEPESLRSGESRKDWLPVHQPIC